MARQTTNTLRKQYIENVSRNLGKVREGREGGYCNFKVFGEGPTGKGQLEYRPEGEVGG